MALYIDDKLVIEHCKTDRGLSLIMNWIHNKGDYAYLDRRDDCFIITVDCYEDGINKFPSSKNIRSNIVTIPLDKKLGGDKIIVNPFTVRTRRKKLKMWKIYDSNGSWKGLDSEDYSNSYQSPLDIYKSIFDSDDYEIVEMNLTSELRDYILTIPKIIRDTKLDDLLDAKRIHDRNKVRKSKITKINNELQKTL